MSDYSSLPTSLHPEQIHLKNLFLDPNNPRFTYDESEWTPDTDVARDSVQEITANKLVTHYSVDSLRMSIETNGYLPIDRVVVRKIEDNTYVVMEGNRRICAAKQVAALEGKPVQIAPEVFQSLKVIPCLVYTGTDGDASWIFQGIRHIQGIAEWSPYHKAKLLVDTMEAEDVNLTEVGKRFGLTAHGAGQWVRGYYAFKQAREQSDFVNEIDHRSYTYFQELFSRSSSALREWMDWDDNAYQFRQLINLNEFVSWIYPRSDDDEGDDLNRNGVGEWEKRIIRTRDHIRQISAIASEAPDLFQVFRQNRKLDTAHQALQLRQIEAAERTTDRVETLFRALDTAASELDNIPHKAVSNPVSRKRLASITSRLKTLIDGLELSET